MASINQMIHSYLYLSSLLIWTTFYIIGLAFLKRYYKSILFASVTALPQALFALILVYWKPERLSIFGIGLEDFLFSFLGGGLVWICTLLVFRNELYFGFITKTNFVRLAICLLFGLASVTVLHFLRISNYMAAFITMIFWIIFILIIKIEYAKISLATAGIFLVVYAIDLKMGLMIWPELISFWSFEHLTGITLLKMPLEELIWAFLYGGSWSLGVAYILNVKLEPKPVREV